MVQKLGRQLEKLCHVTQRIIVIMLRLLLSLILIVSIAPSCAAFEKGFYAAARPEDVKELSARRRAGESVEGAVIRTNPVITQIFGTAEKADRTFWCRSLDKIDVGTGKTMSPEVVGGTTYVGRSPTYFKREDIRDFLKREKHKDF